MYICEEIKIQNIWHRWWLNLLFQASIYFGNIMHLLCQSELDESVKPWCRAAVRHCVRGLHILGELSCNVDTWYSFLFLFLFLDFFIDWLINFSTILKYFFTFACHNRISNGRNKTMWSKMKSTTWFSWSKMTKYPRSVIFLHSSFSHYAWTDVKTTAFVCMIKLLVVLQCI